MAEPSFPVRATTDEELGEKRVKALHAHFSLKRNGGGCCNLTSLSPTEFRITYVAKGAQERVLAMREHQVKSEGQIFRVVIRKDEAPPSESTPQPKKPPPVPPKPTKLPPKPTPPKQVEESIVDPDSDPDSAQSLKSLGSVPNRKKLEAYPFLIPRRLQQHLQKHQQAFLELQDHLQNLNCHCSPLDKNTEEGQILIIRSDDPNKLPLPKWKSLVELVLQMFFSKTKPQHDGGPSGATSLVSTASDASLQTVSSLESKPFKSCTSSLPTLNLTTSNCRLQSPVKYLMVQESFEKEMKSRFPNLEFSFTEQQLHLKGTSEEVRWARERLQECLTEVREHLVDLPEARRQFLKSCPPEELSEILFSQMCGKVSLEVNNEVSLFGISPDPDLLNEAEKLLLDGVQEMVIDIEEADLPATRTSGWRELLSSASIQADKRLKVCSDATPSHGCSRVRLVGFRDQVCKVKEMLLKYLQEEAIVQEEVKLKTVPFAESVEDILRMLKIEKLSADTKVQQLPIPAVLLKGTKVAIAQSKAALEKAQESLIHEILTLPKVGAYKYFREAGHDGLSVIGRNSNCLINWKDNPLDTDASFGAQVRPQEQTMVADTRCTFQLQGGLEIFVCLGDITTQRVDTIVNAANQDLTHYGGLAAAISRAGGPTIQKESSDWVRSHGKVLVGQAAMTSAGKLPCRKVIHAVGPVNNQKSAMQKNAGYLKSAISTSLNLAENEKFSSIAIPCLSSGIFGMPIALCAEWIVDALKSFTEMYSQASHSLREVILIDTRKEAVHELQKSCIKVWGGLASARPGGTSAGAAFRAQATTPSAMKVTFHLGSLENQTADVLVVPVFCQNSVLTTMRAGEALLKKAGDGFSSLYTSIIQGKKFTAGDVVEVDVVAGGFPLPCRTVLFLSCSHWDGENGAAAQALRSGFDSCFRNCKALGASMVAVPVIGPGLALGFPDQSAARIFCQEARKFGASQTCVAEIQLVVHPSTPHLLKEFQDAQKDVESGRIQSQDGGGLYHLVQSTADSIQMRVGKYTVHVTLGDLLKEETDAIVNPTNFKSWNQGSVAHAVFSSAGTAITDEVKGAQTPHGDIFISGPGDLSCQHIMHICIESTAKKIQHSVKKVLKKCQEMNYTSVALPAIGTGEGKMAPQVSAAAIIDSIASLARSHSPSSLDEIHLVPSHQNTFDAYKRELERRPGPPAPTSNTVVDILKKCAKHIKNVCTSKRPEIFESQKVPRPAEFDILAASKTDAEAAKNAIEQIFEKNWKDMDFEDKQISNLQSLDVQTILGWGDASDVHVTIEKGLGNRIRLQGYERDVMEILVKIKNLLINLLQRSYEDIQQERTSLVVQWMYRLDEAYVPVDGMTNCLLETHYEEHGHSTGTGAGVKVSLAGKEATVDFGKMEAKLSGTNKVAGLKRIDVGSGFDLPWDWDDMHGQLLTLVELKASSNEYKGVQAEFSRTTSGLSIMKIQRIQNMYLQLAYELKKKFIADKNGLGEVNEMRLFHGTAPENCDSINLHGFNRRYDAANAKLYGEGVYFAVQASYSAETNYSRADPQTGLRFMYQTKVVAGRYTLGKRGMRVPPARPSSQTNDLYDSVVNNVATPAMYVVFHDDQAYPEYLITFQ